MRSVEGRERGVIHRKKGKRGRGEKGGVGERWECRGGDGMRVEWEAKESEIGALGMRKGEAGGGRGWK